MLFQASLNVEPVPRELFSSSCGAIDNVTSQAPSCFSTSSWSFGSFYICAVQKKIKPIVEPCWFRASLNVEPVPRELFSSSTLHYTIRLDLTQRRQLASVAASTGVPAAKLIRIGVERLVEQIRRDGGLLLPLQDADRASTGV
jgi:hypothetical protein